MVPLVTQNKIVRVRLYTEPSWMPQLTNRRSVLPFSVVKPLHPVVEGVGDDDLVVLLVVGHCSGVFELAWSISVSSNADKGIVV